MNVGRLPAVLDRIDAIESRFGRPARPVTDPTRPRAGLAFDAVLGQQTATTSAVADPLAATGRPPVFATPLSGDIESMYGDVDRLAATGALGTTSTGYVASALDRLAAIGALPVGGAAVQPAGAAVQPAGAVGTSATTVADAVPAATPFAAEFERAGRQHGVPPRLLAAVGWVESRYQVDALSPDGAIGVMQIMPMTAEELGVDPHDPIDAIDGAARLLASHQRRFGSWDLALAAYHSGAGAVSRNGNQPPPRAATYVQLVHDRLERT